MLTPFSAILYLGDPKSVLISVTVGDPKSVLISVTVGRISVTVGDPKSGRISVTVGDPKSGLISVTVGDPKSVLISVTVGDPKSVLISVTVGDPKSGLISVTVGDPKSGLISVTVGDPKSGLISVTVGDPKSVLISVTVGDPKSGLISVTVGDPKSGRISVTVGDPKSGLISVTVGDPKSGRISVTVGEIVLNENYLEELLHSLGLQHHPRKKLTLSILLEIRYYTPTDRTNQSLQSLPWCFLRKLMMMNTTARSISCAAKKAPTSQDLDSLLGDDSSDEGEGVNPLDLITALFLCSDGFLQQEMAVKMSMCQFSVPLLLPNSDTQQPTLMLWALRDIVKKFRPHSFLESKGFVEQSIVLTQLPLISFVRLGNSSLSKSHILNQILSNPQQYHDTFIHRNMTGGDTPKRISEGLVEISWYLPCGNRNMDILPEPVAVANLRGDISAFGTQFSFLCKISSAVFVFCDDFQDCEILNPKHIKAQLFLVCSTQNSSFNREAFKEHVTRLQIPPNHIIPKTQKVNDAEFIKKLNAKISDVIKENPLKMSVKHMSAIAHESGISVDEDYIHCQNAKVKANAITASISDVLKYKQTQLPLQGEIWKELARLEKEECRLKKAGDKNIEKYKSELRQQKQRLRERQRSNGMSTALSCFISALSSPKEERSYFLKWMKISLDHLSLRHLSDLREMYKELCLNSPQNKRKIHDLDRQIASSSLGVEHFLREMGQLYEVACSLPENHPYRQQMQNLPRYCAQLLLDGLPVELIDGDASNIPLQWVKDVLTELHHLTHPNSRIRVITVLGVQSTGKSTLLNAMFGVQFAVSSGKCTRGAFMLLIRVQEDFREQLGCDFIMVIDTEGLKSPELAQLAESYDHDNELATLVVGLSDITIINIAMENSTEMKDVLQIVVHAFLRMKEVGKKPCCMFVHQNVADVSAHDKNMRDRNLLLEQLNEMTQAAARMEKRIENKKFTDVMDYDPERNTWYIPGLWHGTPPMAPVNAGYSEKVSEFKFNIIEALKKVKLVRPAHTIREFLDWTSSLWKAVKYENFIFSFQNSLVADAYTKLCSEYNMWEWDFRKHFYTWMTDAETVVSNFGAVMMAQPASSLDNLLIHLKNEASVELDKGLKEITEKVTEYFERKEGHVCLVEKYREDFMNSAKTLKRETQNSVMRKLEAAVEIKKGMKKVENIRKNHKTTIEQQVLKLLDSCRQAKTQMSEKQLELEFEKMWKETMQKLSFTGLPRQNVGQEIYRLLRSNLETKGGPVHEMLHKASRLDQCGREPFDVGKDKSVVVKYFQTVFKPEQIRKMQETKEMSDSIIKRSEQLIADKLATGTDFHNTHVLELLGLIDKDLERHSDLGISAELEASLKIHICGHAAREFQKMHDAFIMFNDPQQCLEKFKHQYCTDFKDLFHERDQCNKKAEEFTTLCLKPAVREYVTKSLGPEIMDEMLTGVKASDFSNRSFFQFSILKQLLLGDEFGEFLQYITSYEDFVKEWILGEIEELLSSRDGINIIDMEEKQLKLITRKIKEAVVNVQIRTVKRTKEDMNIQTFIQEICSNLSELLVIPKDVLDAVMLLNKAKPEQFSDWLLSSISEMEQSLTAEFQSSDADVRTRLATLPFKPQDELFRRLFGCGKQCPFCKAPCEAGGESHTEHFTSIHRPEGLGRYRWETSETLIPDICSSLVASECRFRCSDTNWVYHPYKDYRKFYPDWRIQADTSIQASVYWKFVFAKFNTQFAEEYEAQPADLPEDWSLITEEQALQSLEETFNMKTSE
ncbi:hypothetical protein JZ751_015443 [Albula glossodonta]|uniref:VLIG-type G domain-containing protein n=1 Tax=Albula glossodonta TaxID=121402 RepID=A0A8T2N3M8_9TELE|nr:hypothetical protein JZ751_015443 [Albula glossodonta]